MFLDSPRLHSPFRPFPGLPCPGPLRRPIPPSLPPPSNPNDPSQVRPHCLGSARSWDPPSVHHLRSAPGLSGRRPFARPRRPPGRRFPLASSSRMSPSRRRGLCGVRGDIHAKGGLATSRAHSRRGPVLGPGLRPSMGALGVRTRPPGRRAGRKRRTVRPLAFGAGTPLRPHGRALQRLEMRSPFLLPFV